MLNKKQITFLIAVLAIFLSACAPVEKNTKAAPAFKFSAEQEIAILRLKLGAAHEVALQGYSSIELGEFSMDGCSSRHSIGLRFDAKDVQENDVSGVVCGEFSDRDITATWTIGR
jgi:hypothetical protein